MNVSNYTQCGISDERICVVHIFWGASAIVVSAIHVFGLLRI